MSGGPHLVPHVVQLVSGSHACRARAHNGNAEASAGDGAAGHHPALLVCTVDNGTLNALDGHRILQQTQTWVYPWFVVTSRWCWLIVLELGVRRSVLRRIPGSPALLP